MTGIRATVIVLGAVLLVGVTSGCADSTSDGELPNQAQMVDDGSWYVKERWPHDGSPYETEHFVVYSDGASTEARERLAALAEEVLVEVIDDMGVEPTTFRFPADQEKIDLYANRYNVLWGGGARAYHAGVIIWSFDHEAGPESTRVAAVRVALKHELIHVVEALLKGRFTGDVAVSDPRRMPTWFSEGTAEALSGGSTAGKPRTVDQMNGLIADYGQINPIAWRVDLPPSDYVLLDAYPNYYYPMAQLAVEYLLDPEGLGKSPQDLGAVMLDMGNDASFAEAFEDHIGIAESDYESQFFARMDAYLPQSEFPFEAAALALVSLLAASVMGGSVVWGLRRWPAGAAMSPQPGVTAWTRRARMGFVAEVSTLAAVAVGIFVLVVFSIGFDDLPAGANRALAYAVTAGYFVASAGILIWAIRRWVDRSRRAYLIPPLVVVATVILIDLINRILL